MATEVASLPRLGRLRVLLIPRNASGVGEAVAAPTVLWSLTNQQEAVWTYAQVSFLPDLPFLLAFEGVRASSVLGLFAVGLVLHTLLLRPWCRNQFDSF